MNSSNKIYKIPKASYNYEVSDLVAVIGDPANTFIGYANADGFINDSIEIIVLFGTPAF